jgi:hypothetical protein
MVFARRPARPNGRKPRKSPPGNRVPSNIRTQVPLAPTEDRLLNPHRIAIQISKDWDDEATIREAISLAKQVLNIGDRKYTLLTTKKNANIELAKKIWAESGGLERPYTADYAKYAEKGSAIYRERDAAMIGSGVALGVVLFRPGPNPDRGVLRIAKLLALNMVPVHYWIADDEGFGPYTYSLNPPEF